jgi:hypothetical protein
MFEASVSINSSGRTGEMLCLLEYSQSRGCVGLVPVGSVGGSCSRSLLPVDLERENEYHLDD